MRQGLAVRCASQGTGASAAFVYRARQSKIQPKLSGKRQKDYAGDYSISDLAECGQLSIARSCATKSRYSARDSHMSLRMT